MGSQDKQAALIKSLSIYYTKMTKFLIIFAIILATTVLIQAFPQAAITESAQQKPFDNFDTDGDGLLKRKEFIKGLRAFIKNIKETRKITRKKMKADFAAADINDDNRLDFEEFKTINIIQKFTNTAITTAATTAAVIGLENDGENCWSACNEIQGKCSWCGAEGYCCRKDWQTGNGCDGTFGGNGHHECHLKSSKK